jgi:hypothetical protein
MLPKVLFALAALASTACAQQFTPLWDGKTLTGWHPIGKGEWRIESDSIVGRHSRDEPAFGHLVTDAIYGDFVVRLKFKTVSGNSGLYFRIDETGFSGVSGFQAEIDPFNDVGGLYETNGRAWVVKPASEQVKTWFKSGEWNEMTVSAQGKKITVTVNGKVTAALEDETGRKQGRIALQLHGAQEGLVYFKEIELLTQ